MHIAILEDDQDQAHLMQKWLEAAGHSCVHYGAGKTLIEALTHIHFDLLVLDKQLPDISGDEVLVWVRQNISWHIPIIFVTVYNTEEEIVKTLELGADDYVTKSVNSTELRAQLRARVSALGRRVDRMLADKIFYFGHIQFNATNRNVTLDDDEVELTPKEFDLALFLFQHAGRLLSREDILEQVWGRTAKIHTRTVDTHISRIRSRLRLGKDIGWSLKAVYHYGYRMESNEDAINHSVVV
jgi:DNA-binding response OmpR family regulator